MAGSILEAFCFEKLDRHQRHLVIGRHGRERKTSPSGLSRLTPLVIGREEVNEFGHDQISRP